MINRLGVIMGQEDLYIENFDGPLLIVVKVRCAIERRLMGILEKNSVESTRVVSAVRFARLCFDQGLINKEQMERILSVYYCCNHFLFGDNIDSPSEVSSNIVY